MKLGATRPYLVDATSGKKIWKPKPRSLMSAQSAARRIAKKTGHVIEVRDDFGTYFTADPPRANSGLTFETTKLIASHKRMGAAAAKSAVRLARAGDRQGAAEYREKADRHFEAAHSLEAQSRRKNPKGRTRFDRCVKAVKRSRTAADPRAVCGAQRAHRKNRGRVNSVPAAQERYERFHGHPSKELVEVKTKVHHHSATSALGDLKKLVIQPEKGPRVKVQNFKGAFLTQNEAGTQLFIDGGDQAVNLADFGIHRKPPHEMEVLGKCLNVYYFTTKDHLRPEDGGTAVYNHKFGRVKPTIIYDVRNRLLSFAGGGYTIPDEGIDG